MTMQKMFFEALNKNGVATAFYTPKLETTWGYEQPAALKAYEELARDFNISTAEIVRTKQTHTSCVKTVNQENGGEGVAKPFGALGFDGMITNSEKLMLCTLEADCVPVFLLDPVRRAIGMVHSGWRGTAGQITAAAITLMENSYGCRPENILVGIGPHICATCYEVSADLYAPFAEKYSETELEKLFQPENGKEGKYLLNLQEAIRITALKAGVLPHNFYYCGHCTFHEDIFDSYRKNGGKDYRMLTGIMLNSV